MSDTNTIIEAPIVLTLKCNDSRDSPWLVLRATNAQQLQSQLLELENSTLFADVGRVAAVFQAQGVLGAKLGAKGIDPVVDGGSFDNVQAATTTPPAVTQPPAAAPTKFPKFGAAKPAATPAATPPPASTERPPADPPPAAPAAGGFPAAPAWKRP